MKGKGLRLEDLRLDLLCIVRGWLDLEAHPEDAHAGLTIAAATIEQLIEEWDGDSEHSAEEKYAIELARLGEGSES